MAKSFLTIACLLLAQTVAFAEKPSPNTVLFEKEVKPLLTKLCIHCHGPKEQESDFRLDKLNPDLFTGADGEHWEEVLNQLGGGDMPPKDETQPTAAERKTISDWIHSEMKRAAAFRSSTGGQVVMRRLTRYEYNYALQDLFGNQLNHTKEMPDDRADEDGLKNNGQLLGITPVQFDMYYEAAKTSVRKALVGAEKPEVFHHTFETEGPPPKLKTGENTQNKSPGVKGQNFSKTKEGVILGPEGVYAVRFSDRPWEGLFRLRCKMGAISKNLERTPRIKVYLGYQATGVVYAKELLGELEVKGTQEAPELVEITGYVEEFPHPFVDTASTRANQKDLIIWFEESTPNNGSPEDRKALKQLSSTNGDKSLARKLKKLNQEQKAAKKKKDQVALEKITKEIEKLKSDSQQSAADKAKKKAEIQARLTSVFIDSIEFEGPFFESWPPKSRTDLLEQPEKHDDPAYAHSVLEKFMTRIWRRPVAKEEVEKVTNVFLALKKESDFEQAMTDTMAAVLCSPNFLYLVEPAKKVNSNRLTAFELASRLSFFLWASMPDEELNQLAKSGELLDRKILSQQIDRMLNSEKSYRFTDQFVAQWLDLDSMDRVAVNPEYYPDFEMETKASMREETLAYFRFILSQDRSCLELLDSDYALLNDRLAKHYGIEGVNGSEFRQVKVTAEQHRGGLVSQAAFMLSNSDGADSHPIFRGKWILKRLLNDPPPNPPANVPELDQADPNFAKLPLKEKLKIHRENAACASCHDDLDPWGLALENYDAVGRWRTEVKVKGSKNQSIPVEASVALGNGAKLDGVAGLKKYLVENKKEQFSEGFVRRLLAFALGRKLEWTDRERVNGLTEQFMTENGYKLRPLIKNIVLSEAFQSK